MRFAAGYVIADDPVPMDFNRVGIGVLGRRFGNRKNLI
jgi:hypothetical protein